MNHSSDWQDLRVPEAVQGKALALGQPGQQWLRELPDQLRALEREWCLTIGETLTGGSAAFVAGVITDAGDTAVLKLYLPGYDDVSNEIRVLRLADGRGYAQLLRADAERGALLLERLGPRLSQSGMPVREQIAVACATLQHAWLQAPEASTFMTGGAKARWLHNFIAQAWDSLDRPCSERVIEHALAFALQLEAAFDPARAVLVHGDPHSDNLLAAVDGAAVSATCKFIDPDGLFAERALDLGVLLRGWNAEMLAGDALQLGHELCAYMSQLTGESIAAIWQWGFTERVSTGLFLMQTGRADEGLDFLRVAEAWVAG